MISKKYKTIEYLQSLITKDEIIEKYSSGISYAKLAKMLNITDPQMKSLLLSYQIFGDEKHSQTKLFVERISRDVLENIVLNNNSTDAASFFNTSVGILKNAMIYYNIKIDPKTVGIKSRETKNNMPEDKKKIYYEKLRASTMSWWERKTDEEKRKILEKAENTKRRNNTFNISKPEESLYSDLCEIYGVNNVVKQYKNDLYPYNCDFYIKSENIYIELNFFWVHGEHPFNIFDHYDIMDKDYYFYKATTNPAFLKKLDTWTNTDIKKIRTAIKNGLRYIVIYKNRIYSTINKINIGKYGEKEWTPLIGEECFDV